MQVCSIGSTRVNVILRLHFVSRSTIPPQFMTETSIAFRRPPGPSQPVTLGIDAETLGVLQRLQAEYGDIVSMSRQNGRLAYFINDPVEVRRILVKRHGKYSKGPGFERVKMLLGNGLIVSDGDTWRRARRMIQPAFTRQKIHRLLRVMAQCSERRAIRWTELAARDGVINITQETSEFALELILISIFGSDYASRIVVDGDNPFAFLSRDSTRDLRIVMQVQELRDLLLDIIASRRSRDSEEDFDLLSMYVQATDKDGVGFTDKELFDELMTLIVAGFETSANTLNWVWYEVARHADVEARLLVEARDVLQDVSELSHERLAAMSYTQQVLEETLRLYPPVWLFTRRADAADELADYDVPAGTDIYLSPYVLHRTAHYWSDPDRFDPDRFAAADTPQKERPFFPFSLGPRRCLGEYFSFLEMKVHLGLLLPRFHMATVDDSEPEFELGINLRTTRDIMLRLTLRK